MKVVIPVVSAYVITRYILDSVGQHYLGTSQDDNNNRDSDELDSRTKLIVNGQYEDRGINITLGGNGKEVVTDVTAPSKFRRYILRKIRLKYHIDDYPSTNVSRGIIRRYAMSLIMKETKTIRTVDLYRNLDFIVELFFVPSPVDVRMSRFRQSYGRLWRINEYTQKYSRTWFNIAFVANKVLKYFPFTPKFKFELEGESRV
jgi:hypothetical protein